FAHAECTEHHTIRGESCDAFDAWANARDRVRYGAVGVSRLCPPYALWRYALAFACAMKARQPPKAEMSRAPCVAAASARKPLTLRPSASVSVPIDRGGGTLATKRPNASAGIAQISTAMAAPLASTRMSPGFAGAPGSRNRR